MNAQPGWYPDPASSGHLRWWTGETWTTAVHAVAPPAQLVPARPVSAPPVSAPRVAGDVWLPAPFVEYGHVPPVCVRHGERAVRMQRAPVYSRTPWWVIPICLFTLIGGLIVAVVIRTTVWGPWPVCRQCEYRRRVNRMLTVGLIGATVLSLVGGVALGSGGLALLSIPLVVLVVVFHDLSDWRRVTAAVADRQTRVVHVSSASPAFLAALP